MAEAAPGRALRLWQVAGVLLLGWTAGRLPDLLADSRAEADRLRGGAPSDPASEAAAPGAAGGSDPRVAAEIAAAVASQVAADTVARLVAAGWGPAGPAPGRPAGEAIVRIVHEGAAPRPAPAPLAPTPPAGAAGWVLQPMGAPPPAPPHGNPPGPSGLAGQPLAEGPRGAESVDRGATGAPAPPPPGARADAEAFALATAAYRALARGNRRQAAEGLARAIALDPEAPQAEAWGKDLNTLTRRLSLGAFALVRNGSAGDPLAASPVLGASVTGASIGYTLDPLARRRLSLFGRVATGAGPTGALDPETGEAALGIRLDPFPTLPAHVAFERRIALGAFARNAWSARIAGGTGGRFALGRFPAAWDIYGEGGVIGLSDPDLYAGAQGRALLELLRLDRVRLDAGAGAWAAGQDAFVTSHRLDVGPTVSLRFDGLPMTASIDYRIRAVGNAEPGSGLALTIAGSF